MLLTIVLSVFGAFIGANLGASLAFGEIDNAIKWLVISLIYVLLVFVGLVIY